MADEEESAQLVGGQIDADTTPVVVDEDETSTPQKRQHDEGEEDAVVGESSKQTMKKARKRSESVGDDEANEADERSMDPAYEQTRRREELMRRITAAAKGPRRPKKKKADETDLELAADDEVIDIRARMVKAAEEDRIANETRKPATNKLRMLKEAVETLQKTGFQQAILDNNLLEAVKMWLEPLPDKSLPSLNIQRAMFPLLESMYIDTTSLKMSGLGKLMLFYTKRKGVDKNIQRIADRLIETWSRPILKRSSSYRDRQQAIRDYAANAAGHPRMTAAQAQRLAAESAASQATRRARIPESVTGNAFRFAPASQVGSDQMDEAQLSKLAERQRINKFKRSLQAAKR